MKRDTYTVVVNNKLIDRIMIGWTLCSRERLADKLECLAAYLGDEPDLTKPEAWLLDSAAARLRNME